MSGVDLRIINRSKSTGQAGFLTASLCSPTFESRERIRNEARMQRKHTGHKLPRIGIKTTSPSADAPVSPPTRVYFALQRRFKFEFSIPRNGSRRLGTGSS